MSRYIFILGAGASAEAGAPLMGDFLERAADLRRRNIVSDMNSEFDLVALGRAALQRTHSKSTAIDIYNMEAVFSAFETATILGRLDGLDVAQIQRLPSAYKAVIARTLDETVNFHETDKGILPPKPYLSFVNTLKRAIARKQDLSIITFNYDIALDFALHNGGIQTDYALNQATAAGNRIPLLKLHGSLNWKKCSVCKAIVAWPFEQAFNSSAFRGADTSRFARLRTGTQIRHFSCCQTSSDVDRPFIVPPTINKSRDHEQLGNVWKRAAKELSEAEVICVIGYSLPSTDTFFQYLFSLGVTSSTILRKFWIVDFAPSVQERYLKILGETIRPRFKFIQNSFSDALPTIEQIFEE